MEGEKSMSQVYKELWNQVQRPGVDKFLAWLETTDFYTAPCSTKYHLSRPGGLVEHSINVYAALWSQCAVMAEAGKIDRIPAESIVICALGHDICKADFYGQEMRNVKENGKWEQRPYYTVKDNLPYGHGEKSVLLLQHWMKLRVEEVLAVRWHMGGFTPGSSDYSIVSAFSEAAKIHPLIILLHMADLEATYIKESKEDKHGEDS